MRRTTFIGLIILLSLLATSLAHATVYSWQDEHGVLHLTSDPDDVPEAQRSNVKSFTSKQPLQGSAEQQGEAGSAGAPTPLQGTPSAAPAATYEQWERAYEHGLERGLQAGERQAHVTGELARSMITALANLQDARERRQEGPPVVVRYVRPSYGQFAIVAPYLPYASFAPGVAGFAFNSGIIGRRFVPHSHFFPGTLGPPTGLFFPYGHATQNNGFLFGPGFILG